MHSFVQYNSQSLGTLFMRMNMHLYNFKLIKKTDGKPTNTIGQRT